MHGTRGEWSGAWVGWVAQFFVSAPAPAPVSTLLAILYVAPSPRCRLVTPLILILSPFVSPFVSFLHTPLSYHCPLINPSLSPSHCPLSIVSLPTLFGDRLRSLHPSLPGVPPPPSPHSPRGSLNSTRPAPLKKQHMLFLFLSLSLPLVCCTNVCVCIGNG